MQLLTQTVFGADSDATHELADSLMVRAMGQAFLFPFARFYETFVVWKQGINAHSNVIVVSHFGYQCHSLSLSPKVLKNKTRMVSSESP